MKFNPSVRHLLIFFILVIACVGTTEKPQTGNGSPKLTVVIVHGAWGGGWAFRGIDSLLSNQGYTVYRPTLTGLGERVHLATADIDLTTHIKDVVNTFLYEDFNDVILVGHSYGGMVISGVADSIPERIRHLIYLDAFLPQNNESIMSHENNKDDDWIKKMTKANFVVPSWVKPGQVPPKDVPHPLGTLNEPIVLDSELAQQIPGSYILTVEKEKMPTDDEFFDFTDRAKNRGWDVFQLESDHNPQWSAPEAFTELLLTILESINPKRENIPG